jgi:signal transduction histidine kinase
MNNIGTILGTLVTSIDFLLLIIATVAELILAFVVFQSNRKSATNIIFILLSVVTVIWLIMAYSFLEPAFVSRRLIIGRLGIFMAAPMSALFFMFASVFPKDRVQMSKGLFWLVVGGTAVMMVVNISPFAFTGVIISPQGTSLQTGVGILPFSILSTLFSVAAIFVLLKKFRLFKGIEHEQVKLVMLGLVLMLALIIVTVLAPIMANESVAFLPLTPLYTLLFLGMTAYAIVRHQLFNIKVIATQVITIVLWLVLFAKTANSVSINEIIVDVVILIVSVILGSLLIHSVKREVEQREKIEKLATDLEKANAKLRELDQLKSEFLSFASHQIRSPLTAIHGYATMLEQGDYGEMSSGIKEAIGTMSKSSASLVKIVNEFLDISRIEQGRMNYDLTDFDLRRLVFEAAEELKPNIEEKGLTLNISGEEGDCMVNADRGKIKQVIGNLIDNSVKYTPRGNIEVDVKRVDGKILTTVKDTGIGIGKEEISRLFSKFSRTKDAHKTDVTGTGLGLYVAKQMIEAHKGRIWVESEGNGGGSTFFVELPAK